MTPMRKLWLCWLLLVFGLLNLYGPALSSYRRADDPPGVTARALAARLDPLQFLGLLARNDGDTARYFSYANAMLGRPYSNYYVRDMAAWQVPEADAEAPNAPTYHLVAPERPLRPWRDFSMEYPPGMAIFALAPALLTTDFNLYHLLFCLQMELLLTLSVFFAVKTSETLAPGQGARALALLLAATAALGPIAARRYDACVSLSFAMTFLALATRRPAGAGAALAFGVVSKGAPLLAAPLGAIHYAAAGDWRSFFRALAGAAVVGVLAGAGFLALAGEHWRDAFAYHGGRPLQIESTFSALLIALSGLAPGLVGGSANAFGSDNILSPWETALRPVAEIAPLLAMVGIYVWFWRASRACANEAERLEALARGVCAVIVAFAALGKVFSPQYLVWLIPVAALASIHATPRTNLCLFAALGLTQIEYPWLYTFLAGSLPPSFGLLALMRNGALIFWAALLLFAPRREDSRSRMFFSPNWSKSAV